jgi:hypothetical protein
MEYINQMKNRRRSSQVLQAPKPVLTEEEEAYLRQVTSPESGSGTVAKASSPGSEVPPGSSEYPVLNEGAETIPLPASPAEEFGKELGEQGRRTSQLSGGSANKESELVKPQDSGVPEKKKRRWSTMFWKKNADSKKVGLLVLLRRRILFGSID